MFDIPAAIWKLRLGVFDARSGGALGGTPVFMEGQACGAMFPGGAAMGQLAAGARLAAAVAVPEAP